MDTIVVTFDKYFQRGHTYVDLSRSRSLKGLYLRNIDKQYIKVKKDVTTEMLRLKERQLNTDSFVYCYFHCGSLKLFYVLLYVTLCPF